VRRPVVGLLGLALVCGSIATGGAAASAVSTDGAKAPSAVSKAKGQNHDLPNPLEEKRRAEREAHEFNTMSELAKSITKLTCLVKVKTGDDGKMFGSVTSGTIADELKNQFDISLEKKKIHLDHPIRATGEHEIELRLHPEVKATLKVKVESITPAVVVADAADGKDAAQRTEKRGRRAEAEVEAKPAAKAKKSDKAK